MSRCGMILGVLCASLCWPPAARATDHARPAKPWTPFVQGPGDRAWQQAAKAAHGAELVAVIRQPNFQYAPLRGGFTNRPSRSYYVLTAVKQQGGPVLRWSKMTLAPRLLSWIAPPRLEALPPGDAAMRFTEWTKPDVIPARYRPLVPKNYQGLLAETR